MARKKIEPIESLGRDIDKLTVQKSLPLFALWQSDLSLAEFKILDTYLARINSHEPDKRSVIFDRGEIEKCLGVSKINMPDLKNRLYHLMGNVVEVPDDTIKKGFKAITLFEEAVAEQDDYGVWKIKLECTQKAMKYFFNIDNIGYLRYKLRCITSLTSRYTYIMFIYLESNRKMHLSWQVDLEELKEILNCNADRYKAFKYFKTEVLERVKKEMYEKTECKFAYEPIKRGRSVVAIQFTLESLSQIEENDTNQITLEQWQSGTVKEKELWQTPFEQYNFSEEQFEELFSVLVTIPDFKLPQSSACYGSVDLMRYHYMDQKAKEIARRDTQKPIRNKYSYLLKLLKQDAEVYN